MNTLTELYKKIRRFFRKLPEQITSKVFWSHPVTKMVTASAVVLVILLGAFTHRAISAPGTFTVGTLFSIEEGMTLDDIADELESEGYIRSSFLMKVIVKTVFRNGSGAVAGDYSFDKRLSTFGIARRILAGDFRLDPVRVTIPEGLNKYETADLLELYVDNFDTETFLSLATEGYLFPDTYFFPPHVTAERIVDVMRSNFDRRIATHKEEIEAFGKPLDEVITMASIIETEARKFETRKTISSILWRRFHEGMPLQVDVSFKYVNGKTTFDLTMADLGIDSPYNTYKYSGLPPTPIANPGLDSILAAATPTSTEYYFFLSDMDGEMHYARTFDEHLANKDKYLP